MSEPLDNAIVHTTHTIHQPCRPRSATCVSPLAAPRGPSAWRPPGMAAPLGSGLCMAAPLPRYTAHTRAPMREGACVAPRSCVRRTSAMTSARLVRDLVGGKEAAPSPSLRPLAQRAWGQGAWGREHGTRESRGGHGGERRSGRGGVGGEEWEGRSGRGGVGGGARGTRRRRGQQVLSLST